MAGNWKTTTLGEIADASPHAFVDGPFGSNLPASSYTVAGVPLIRGSNLSLGATRFRSDEFVYVSNETATRLQRSCCKPLDIIFTKKGTLSQTGIVPEHGKHKRYLLSGNQMKLTVDRSKADPLFVFYFVSSPPSRAKIIQDSEVTGVPKTNLTYLRTFPILLPPVAEQKDIAAVLGALDDKIELNRRMNATLEAIARALFQSWFVDFDPVRAKLDDRQPPGLDKATAGLFPSTFQDSLFGEIPQGWHVGALDEIAVNPRRGIAADEIDSTEAYMALEHMPRRSIALSDWDRAEGLESNKFKFQRGEILFGKLRPYFHKVGVAPLDGVCSTDILVVSPKEPAWFGFLLSHISSVELVNHTDAASTGTKMPRTNWQDIARFEIVLPPERVSAAFTKMIRPLIEQIISNIHQSRTLALLRDTLLPRLLSGELTLKTAA